MRRFIPHVLGILMLMACSETEDSIMELESIDGTMEEIEEGMDVSSEEGELSGEFMEAAHPTSGVATINVDRTVLRLSDFKSEDGPVLELYLATNTQATDYISLGELQGLEGDFVYQLPEEAIDFDTYNHVLVWCVTFSVNFGHAVLE